MKAKIITSMALATAMSSGCMTEDDPNRRAKMGAIAGAIGGAVIGHQVQGEYGRYVGAAVGALAGGAVGNYMDQQHRELRRALEDELRAEYVTLERIDKDTIKHGDELVCSHEMCRKQGVKVCLMMMDVQESSCIF